jgi:TPR repeat protein
VLGHASTVTALGWCEPLFPPPGIDAQVWNDAQDGISSAQLALGRAHQKNFGDADTNLIEAVKWFTKAALQGNSDAQQALGRAYALGIGGLQRNEAKAIEMFEAAAAKNVNYAWALAETFMNTLGCVGYDYDKAEAWYAAGALCTRGGVVCSDAQREWTLGDMYSKGLGGLAKDEAKAEECYRRSAHADHFRKEKLYPGKLFEHYSLGTKEYELGRKCELGEGVSQDAVKAAVWYKASAFGSEEYKFKSSNRNAKYQLALLYEEGRGVERDVVAAMELYKELASHHLKIRSGDWRYKRWLRQYETGRSLPRIPEIKEDEALEGYDRVKKEAMGVLAEREREAAEKKRAQIEADRKMRNERDLMRAEDLLWQAEQEKIRAERNERDLMRAEECRVKQLAIRERQQRAAEKRREQALEFESKRSQDDPEPVYPGVYWDATADGARPWRAQPQFPAGPEFFGHYPTKEWARSVCQDKVWAHQRGYDVENKKEHSVCEHLTDGGYVCFDCIDAGVNMYVPPLLV